MSVNPEIELKGTICLAYLGRVKNLPAIKKHTVRQARSRKLVTVYFDTPDHDLRRLGMSLRVRKVCPDRTTTGTGPTYNRGHIGVQVSRSCVLSCLQLVAPASGCKMTNRPRTDL